MKYEKYISLIKKLETYAATNPKLYQYRVLALALLGYAYILGLIFVCIFVPILLLIALILNPEIVIRTLLPLLKVWLLLVPAGAIFFSFLAGAISSLTAKVPAPEGKELYQDQAPKLFEIVEKTCKELKAQKPERILVDDIFNASVITTPRFGIFGRKVYLNLGLPLMYALSPEQFRAVLTHEIGHISGKHGGFSKWAYQLEESWRRFIESQELQEHKMAFLYEKFIKWFFPFFSAYSFVLMRKHEHEADDYTVQLVGAKALGEALINLEIKGTKLNQDFWQEIFDENATRNEPPTELFSRMALAFRKQDTTSETQNLKKFVDIKTDYTDTHPSLAERLQTIGYWKEGDLPALPEAVGENAAEVFLGSVLEHFTVRFNREWQEKISKNWKTNYEYLQKSGERLEELSGKEDLTSAELFEKANLIGERQGNEAALPLILRLLEIEPEHADANYILGGILLEKNDESGFPYLNKAMHLDKRLKVAASEIAFNYLRLKGRHEEAKPYVEIIETEREIMEKAERERSNVNPTDTFESHKLSAETLNSVIEKISNNDNIETAYLAAKKVQFYPDFPLHILFLYIKQTGTINVQSIVERVSDRVAEFGIQYVYAFGNNDNQFRSRIAAIENSKILG